MEQLAVIVIDPELEAWIVNENEYPARIIRCPTDYRKLLADAQFWPPEAVKPPDPKEALQYLRRRHRVRVGNAEFGKLAEAMSVRQCQDPAFLQLREWFPTVPEMKLADLRNPVRSNWLTDQRFRLDASPYLSGAYEARKLLERLAGTKALHETHYRPRRRDF